MTNEDMFQKILDKLDKIENNQNDIKEDVRIIKETVATNREILENHTHEVGKLKIVND